MATPPSPYTMPAATPAPAAAAAPTVRPTGITVLAVLSAIGALFAVLGALAALAMGSMGAMLGEGGGMFAMFGAAAAVFMLVMAAIYAASAWGLWTQKRWAWYLALAGAALGIVNGVVSLPGGILAIAIGAFVGWYLLSPSVQAWFGVSHNTPWKYSQPS